MTKKFPIIDLHCDLTSYLIEVPGSHHSHTNDIGCATPFLKEGNVKMQVLAMYTNTSSGSTQMAQAQIDTYLELIKNEAFFAIPALESPSELLHKEGCGIVLAIENASGICEEGEPLSKGKERLLSYMDQAGDLFYIGFTHHLENRFGGGNKTEAGLKDDGKALLEWMAELDIAVDLSHASDRLAYGILDYSDKMGLNLKILASHSNFRAIWDHKRNLPEALVQEIIRRKGLIGMNFLREYIDRQRPEALEEHILHGLQQANARDSLCFGADYFYVAGIDDPSRVPWYFPEHEHAGVSYQPLLQRLQKAGCDGESLNALAYRNVIAFMEQHWKLKARSQKM